MVARIRFAGNPWRHGHAVAEAEWTAVLGRDGLRFHLHVKSAHYDAEDDRQDQRDPESAWKARIVWRNYGACTLSSTMWGHDGILVATPGRPIDLERLEDRTLRVDRIDGDTLPVDLELDDLAFGIYLLGHDTVCDHRIRFVKRRGPSTYDVRWRARIALTYAGSLQLEHALDATLPKLRLAAIEIGRGMRANMARELLAETVVGRFALRGRRFVKTR